MNRATESAFLNSLGILCHFRGIIICVICIFSEKLMVFSKNNPSFKIFLMFGILEFFNASKKTSIRHESITKNKTFGFFAMIIILGIGFQPMQYKVSVIGMGFVGLSLSSFLATKNIHVIGIDSDEEKISKISKGVTPFFEPKLKNLLKIALKKSFQLTKISKKAHHNTHAKENLKQDI